MVPMRRCMMPGPTALMRRCFHPTNSKKRLPWAVMSLAWSSSSSDHSSTGPVSGPSSICIHESVRDALASNRPVVALESTIVAHGMPYPDNLLLSQKVASILRSRGVEPATIAVRDGVCCIGLTVGELEDLAHAGEQGRSQKCSTRELSLLLARTAAAAGRDPTSETRGKHEHNKTTWGATTVASTMVLAHAAGISTFVTGGIGGVHRHGEVTMDVSADLTELSRTPVVVVSAGIKSILDVDRTLQVLETNGVPAVAYRSDNFPAFFSPSSGVPAPARVDDAHEVASAYWAARDLRLPHGMLVAVPNDDPAGAKVEDAIQCALVEAEEEGIRGQAVTPFVLRRVADKTEGDSLRSNVALVERNAAVGAEIAIAIALQRQRRRKAEDDDYDVDAASRGAVSVFSSTPKTDGIVPPSRVVVVGGIVSDIVAKPKGGGDLILGTSNPSVITETDGGVGRNVAEVLGRLGVEPLLYSAVGDDVRGRTMLDRLQRECGVPAIHSTVRTVRDAATATFLAVLEGSTGDLHVASADTAVLSQIPLPPPEVLERAEILVLDANVPTETLREAAHRACEADTAVFWEPTSVPKAREVSRDDAFLSCLSYASPNIDELAAMADGWTSTSEDLETLRPHTSFAAVEQLAARVLERMNPNGAVHLLTTLGEQGVLLGSRGNGAASPPTFRHFSAVADVEAKNSTGAGDSLAGAFVHAILHGKEVPLAVEAGMRAAAMSLKRSDRTVCPTLSDLKD